MTSAGQPESGFAPDDEFKPVYTPPAWYAENTSQAPDTGSPPVPWYSVYPRPGQPPACRQCGVTPAAVVTIRAHRGLILAARWQHIDGPFCGLCGIALVRDMTTTTLWKGWWSLVSLIVGAPFSLVSNGIAYRKLRQLQPAVPAPGTRQIPLGKPVLHRPASYVALIPLILAAAVIARALTTAA
ncbi:hypothetical protein ACIQPR_09805 [Streptomyces sp. NPDC091280]|uniref:hypothetical protein n=1 Tax=Streptomyces sp. NPDC091280 TaxID=3365984 RepID=UPI00381F428C